METLAYLHLALTYEESLDESDAPCGVRQQFVRKINGRTWLKRSHYCLLALGATLGILGTTTQALALIQQGDRGTQVNRVQKRLQELNFFTEEPTGYFGEVTVEAVKQFQRDRGLDPDGIVGAETETELFGQAPSNSPFNQEGFLTQDSQASIYPDLELDGSLENREIQEPFAQQEDQIPTATLDPIPQEDFQPENIAPTPAQNSLSSGEVLTVGDRGESVSTLQSALNAEGFSPGAIDGIYGPQTQQAVIAFQRSRGLNVDGVAGEQTLSTLNLVSSNPSQRLYSVTVRNS